MIHANDREVMSTVVLLCREGHRYLAGTPCPLCEIARLREYEKALLSAFPLQDANGGSPAMDPASPGCMAVVIVDTITALRARVERAKERANQTSLRMAEVWRQARLIGLSRCEYKDGDEVCEYPAVLCIRHAGHDTCTELMKQAEESVTDLRISSGKLAADCERLERERDTARMKTVTLRACQHEDAQGKRDCEYGAVLCIHHGGHDACAVELMQERRRAEGFEQQVRTLAAAHRDAVELAKKKERLRKDAMYLVQAAEEQRDKAQRERDEAREDLLRLHKMYDTLSMAVSLVQVSDARLTLAAAALAGMLSDPTVDKSDPQVPPTVWRIADATLAVLTARSK